MSISQKIKFVAVAAIASGALSAALFFALSFWMDERSAGLASVTGAIIFVTGMSTMIANSYRGRLPKQRG
jgi:hypothetical protein